VVAALTAEGYVAQGTVGGGSVADAGDGDGASATFDAIEVRDRDNHVGAAVVGIYSSLDATTMFDDPVGDPKLWCGPAISTDSTFAWDGCDLSGSPAGQVIVSTGHDSRGEMLGAVLLRANGSVLGISVSTASYNGGAAVDEGAGETAADDSEPLDHLPLSEAQLMELLKVIEGTLSAN
jgi:hypothetical protein